MNEKTSAIRIPPKGTKGSSMPGGKVLMRLAKPLIDRQTAKYKNVKTAEQAKFMGFPAVVLTTVGAKTGKEHSHVLGGFPDGKDAWLVIASAGGAPSHPAWFFNLAKNPDQVWLHVGNRRLKVDVESLQGIEREKAYDRVVAVAKNYAGYPKKTDREIPVLRLTSAE
jgi:deazaflavin-dependent oxidoreductase (nitroreductase family)